MRYRVLLFLVTAFFVTMNVLLWRSEFAGASRFGTPVPAEVVWQKVLTSPDNSFLEIRHKGVKIGRAHWLATIGEELPTGKTTTEDVAPEGMVERLRGYSLDFDGNVSLEDLTRLRYIISLKFDTNQNWREFNFKLNIKPFSWTVEASAELERVRLLIDDDEGRREQSYSFAELRNPDQALRALGGPGFSTFLGMLGMPLPKPGDRSFSLGVEWHAHQDRLRVGASDIRVYRVETRLLDRYRVVLFVSPVGEILRMELPDGIVLTNEALTSL